MGCDRWNEGGTAAGGGGGMIEAGGSDDGKCETLANDDVEVCRRGDRARSETVAALQ